MNVVFISMSVHNPLDGESRVLLEDGESRVLLEDGESRVLLEEIIYTLYGLSSLSSRTARRSPIQW